MVVYQPTSSRVQLKKDKGTDYVISWKSKGVDSSFSTTQSFLHKIKFSGYKIGIKFDKEPLVVEQNNYVTKIVNAYIVHNLDDQPKNQSNNFKISFLFFLTNFKKDSNKSKWEYSVCGWCSIVAFDGVGS